MYCGQCGTQNNEEAGHCRTCGAPLLITAGTRTCAACGGSLGDHDRFCPSCGASADDPGSSTSYDASDAFEEIDIDDIDLSELPEWLQDMAIAQGRSASNRSQPVAGQPSPEDLPAWLRETEEGAPSRDTAPPPPAQSPPSSGVQHQPAELFSLVSDDDLPDWLKALGDEEPSDGAQPPATESVVPSESKAVALVFEVPPISRAWLTQGRRPDPSTVASAQQEFAPLEPWTGAADEPEQVDIWTQSTEPFDTQSSQGTASSEGQAEPSAASGGRNVFRLVLVAILLVLILTIAYVVIQGM